MYYVEVQNPQGEWCETNNSYTLLMRATKAMCALVDSGCHVRIVDAPGTVYAQELPHGAESVWDDSYTAPVVRESGIVYRGA